MEGMSILNTDNYKPARLTNRLTGNREEIVLIDTQDDFTERKFLQSIRDYDLRVDLTSALSTFSLVEQRIIIRVLLQGYTYEQATRRTKRSASAWQAWMQKKALPRLRNFLEDYREELTHIGAKLPPPSTFKETPEQPEGTAPCKMCPFIALNFAELRKHWREDHPQQYVCVDAYVHEDDYFIRRDAMALVEIDPPDELNIDNEEAQYESVRSR